MNEAVTKERLAEPTLAPAPNLPAVVEPAKQERKPRVPKVAAPQGAYSGKIAKAVLKITGEIGRIQKEGFNQFQRYKYTKWEDINEKLSPLLVEHGLVIVQNEISRDVIERSAEGCVLAMVYHFILVSEDGDSWPPVEWTAIARLTDKKGTPDDKAAAKCHTQAEKQFCIKQFKIRTDDYGEDDAHSTLPKKDAKDIYTKLQAEIDDFTSAVELGVWGQRTAERITVLPPDWQQHLRNRYAEKLAELKNGEAALDEIIDPETGELPG